MSNTTQGIHTTTHPKGTGWVNQAGGVVLTSHRDKVTAVEQGRLLAKRHGALYTIHRKDGTVVETKSYAVKPLQ